MKFKENKTDKKILTCFQTQENLFQEILASSSAGINCIIAKEELTISVTLALSVSRKKYEKNPIISHSSQ